MGDRVGVELLYNAVKTEVEAVGRGRGSWNWVPVPVEFDAQGSSGVAASWRWDVVGKATSGRWGLWALMSWGPEKMLIRCNKESQHPAEWALGLRLSSPREQERYNVTVITVGSKYYSLCSVSSTLLHANLEQPFRTLQIKWEVNIFYKRSLPASVFVTAS